MTVFIASVIIGLTGAAAFDLWHGLLQRFAGIRAPNWAILGRWLLTPSTIGAPPKPPFQAGERMLGALAHYVTAVVFGLALVLVMGRGWVSAPTIPPALVAGLATTVFAWFLIMPALGAGIAGTRTPAASKMQIVSLSAHAWMGLGFYLGALFARPFL